MESAVGAALVHRVSTAAKREEWRHVLEATWYPPLDHDTDDSALDAAMLSNGWVCQPSDIPGVDTQRVSRWRRSIDTELRAKALFRMLRTQCHHNSESPGSIVAAHPRVVRGPNAGRQIHLADSPVAGLVHA
jgi:hypothetical protein